MENQKQQNMPEDKQLSQIGGWDCKHFQAKISKGRVKKKIFQKNKSTTKVAIPQKDTSNLSKQKD